MRVVNVLFFLHTIRDGPRMSGAVGNEFAVGCCVKTGVAHVVADRREVRFESQVVITDGNSEIRAQVGNNDQSQGQCNNRCENGARTKRGHLDLLPTEKWTVPSPQQVCDAKRWGVCEIAIHQAQLASDAIVLYIWWLARVKSQSRRDYSLMGCRPRRDLFGLETRRRTRFKFAGQGARKDSAGDGMDSVTISTGFGMLGNDAGLCANAGDADGC